ncbi:MAG: DUF2267 domain-containing protein [Rhizobiales bacterium]|nr:DUF2267 domain-containing protein [Hyphomicrobiales bacterium]OJU29698.1 MAG: hypothetical protein BGN94_14935 [Rhizobiales bacterium 68-8]
MTTGIASFTQAAEQAQQWVNDLGENLGWDIHRSYRLLRSVLHALRDWLSPEEAADLAAQLPMLVRGIYFDGWNPQNAPVPDRSKPRFVERVQCEMGKDTLDDPDRAIAMVFELLERHLDHGELVQVRNSMKKRLRQLWPSH